MKKFSEMTEQEVRYCLDLTKCKDTTGHKRQLLQNLINISLKDKNSASENEPEADKKNSEESKRYDITEFIFNELKSDADRLAIAKELIDNETENLAYDKESRLIDHCLYGMDYPQYDPHRNREAAIMYFITLLRGKWMTQEEAAVLKSGGSCAQALGLA